MVKSIQSKRLMGTVTGGGTALSARCSLTPAAVRRCDPAGSGAATRVPPACRTQAYTYGQAA